MHKIINIQFICTECPKKMNNKNCPVIQYINSEPELFHQSINETVVNLAKPYGEERVKYEWALANIAKLCQNCKQNNK